MLISRVFKCPRCGAPRLEEVMVNATVKSAILSVEGGDIEYSSCNCEGGQVDSFQCADCGWVVPNVHDAQQLHAWLNDPNRDTSDVGDDTKSEWMDDVNYVESVYPNAYIVNAPDGKIKVWADYHHGNTNDVIGLGNTEAEAWKSAADFCRNQ